MRVCMFVLLMGCQPVVPRTLVGSEIGKGRYAERCIACHEDRPISISNIRNTSDCSDPSTFNSRVKSIHKIDFMLTDAEYHELFLHLGRCERDGR
jgi:hypothetical protein